MIETPDVAAALKAAPKEQIVMRNRRLKRASDLNMKHEYLPKELQQHHVDGEQFYLQDLVDAAKKARIERELILGEAGDVKS